MHIASNCHGDTLTEQLSSIPYDANFWHRQIDIEKNLLNKVLTKLWSIYPPIYAIIIAYILYYILLFMRTTLTNLKTLVTMSCRNFPETILSISWKCIYEKSSGWSLCEILVWGSEECSYTVYTFVEVFTYRQFH